MGTGAGGGSAGIGTILAREHVASVSTDSSRISLFRKGRLCGSEPRLQVRDLGALAIDEIGLRGSRKRGGCLLNLCGRELLAEKVRPGGRSQNVSDQLVSIRPDTAQIPKAPTSQSRVHGQDDQLGDRH